MTTADVRLTNADGTPTFTRFLAFRIGKALDKRVTRKKEATAIQVLVRTILNLMGFACLTYAGFLVHTVAGFIVAGLSCFTISLLTGGQSTETGHAGRMT